MMTPLSRTEYDALPDRTNFTTLKHMDLSPQAYLYRLLGRDEDTDAMEFGRAVHTRVYEPELFKSRYVIWEDRRAGKFWNQFKKKHEAEGKEILTIKSHAEVIDLADAIRASTMAAPYLTGGVREQSILWQLERPKMGGLDGYVVQCKGRPDFIRPDCIVDLKTCRSARPRVFGKQAFDLHYYVQAAFYVDGLAIATDTPPRPYFIIAAESKPPYVVQVYRVTEAQLDMGRAKYWEWLDRLDLCKRENSWIGYAAAPLDLELPAYATPPDEIEELEAA